jgi:hypothetical protein
LRRALTATPTLIVFDIIKPINDPAAYLEICRTIASPTPPLQCARADMPAAREIDLIEELISHLPLPFVHGEVMPDYLYAFVLQVGCILNFIKCLIRNANRQNRRAMQTSAYERRPDAYELQTKCRHSADESRRDFA